MPRKKSNLPAKPEEKLDFNAIVPKKYSLDALARRVIKEKDPNALNGLINDFRTMTLKKEVVRLVELSKFSDLADEEIGKRLKEHPERLKNSEVVEFSRLIQDSIDRANRQIDVIRDTASLTMNANTINVTKNELNVNMTTASREKIANVVMSILNSGAVKTTEPVEVNTVEVQPEEPTAEEAVDDQTTSNMKLKEDED